MVLQLQQKGKKKPNILRELVGLLEKSSTSVLYTVTRSKMLNYWAKHSPLGWEPKLETRLPQKNRTKTPTTTPPPKKPQYHNYYTLDHKLLSNLQRHPSSNMPLLTSTTKETAQQNTANTPREL